MNKLIKGMMVLVLASVLVTAANAKEIIRIQGENRYKTAVEISKKSINHADKVIVVAGDKFADAISSSALSMDLEYPILQVEREKVSEEVIKEIKRLNCKEILIVGGENSVSKKVEDELKKLSSVKRIAGDDRVETSKLVYEYKKSLNANSTRYGLATGMDFPDALCAAPYIYKDGSILLYSPDKKDDISPDVIFGGEKSVPGYDGVKRIAGKDRYDTSLLIAKEKKDKGDSIILVSGKDYPDALSSGILAKKENSPIILTDGNKLTNEQKDFINSLDVEDIFIVGGVNSVSIDLENNLKKYYKESEDESFDGKKDKSKNNTIKVDKTELKDLVIKAKKIDKSSLEDDSRNLLEKVIKEAENCLRYSEKQKEIDMVKDKLSKTLKELKYIEYVDIEDPLFRKVVNKNLSMDRKDDAKITREEMESLTELSIFLDENGKATFKEEFKRSILGEPKSLKGTEDFKFLVTRGIKSIKGIEKAVNLKKLKINENEIKDISPLKNLTKLEYLEIQRNRIVDVSPLEKLTNLEFLKLYANLIEDVNPLANLVNLKGLDLHYNVVAKGDESNKIISKGITDISSLKNLTKLEFLDVSANRIKNVDVIKGMKMLNQIDFSSNMVESYEGLGQLIATTLQMQDAGMGSIGFAYQTIDVNKSYDVDDENLSIPCPLKGAEELSTELEKIYEMEKGDVNLFADIQTNIDGVSAIYNKETSSFELSFTPEFFKENNKEEVELSFVAKFAEYSWTFKNIKLKVDYSEEVVAKEYFDFYKNMINKYSKFGGYVNLTDEANKKFDASHKPITGDKITREDLKYLNKFSALNMDVTDKLLAPLKFATNLKYFDVDQMQSGLKRDVEDFSFLKKLSKLENFYFIDNSEQYEKAKIGKLDFSFNKNLTDLRISRTNLSDISFAEKLNPEIKQLSLQDNEITNIDSISKLSGLERLDLDNNKITDINKGLENKPKLITLYLLGNPIKDTEVLKSIKTLEALHLRNTKIKDIEVVKDLPKLHRLYVDENKLNENYFETIKALAGINTLEVADIKLADFEWLKDYAIREAVEATFDEDKARNIGFDNLILDIELDKKDLVAGKISFKNPLADWDKAPVVENTDEEDNERVEFDGDNILIKNVSETDATIKESYNIGIENENFEFGNQTPYIAGKVTLNIQFK